PAGHAHAVITAAAEGNAAVCLVTPTRADATPGGPDVTSAGADATPAGAGAAPGGPAGAEVSSR
ncbi:hypothetical protein GTZ89_18415, partial [Streptomyces sp. SID8382]|nr:hypothetical protein [Streptomyces sp. SID8382]